MSEIFSDFANSWASFWGDPVMWPVLAIAALGGLVRGLSGFGVGLVMMPICAATLGPTVAVPMLAVIDMPTTVWLATKVWRDFDRREVFTIILACAVGAPVGIAMLLIIEPEIIKNFASVIVLLFAAALIFGFKLKGEPSTPRTVSAGLTAGVLMGSVSLPGPPLILVWLAAQLPGKQFRANIIIFFLGMMIVVIPAFAIAGLMTASTLTITAAVFPFFGGGVVVGNLLAGHVPEKAFRKCVLGLVVAGAVAALVT